MINLLWTLLNIGLFLFFIIICFKATKLVREKSGLFASVVFVLGLLSFISKPDNDYNKKPNSDRGKTWEFTTGNSLDPTNTHMMSVDLEKTLVSTNVLGIKYGKDKLGRTNIPISAYSSMTGFVSGTSWIPSIVMVNKKVDNKFEYFVAGVIKWNLLGATIYSQPKTYRSIVMAK